MLKLSTAIAATLLVVAAGGANATVRTLDINASNYQLLFGTSTDTPIEPVNLNVTFDFDTSHDVQGTTAGLTVNHSTLPYASSFAYNAAADLLTLATFAGINSCSNPGNSYCGFISNFTTMPNLFFFQQSTAHGGYFLAHNVVTTLAPVITGTVGGTAGGAVGSVPEPAAWAMMLGGFAFVGVGQRRRRATVVAA